MIFEVFISIVLIFCGAACYFALRNNHIGFRTKKTRSCDYVWQKANALIGILLGMLGSLLFVLSYCGIAFKDFYTIFIIFFSIIIVFSSFQTSKIYNQAKEKNLIDFGSDCPKDLKPKKKSKKAKDADFTFSAGKKISALYCSFCAFLIFLAFAWIKNSLQLFPEKIPANFNVSDYANTFILRDSYAHHFILSFWIVQLCCALALLISAMFFSKSKMFNSPFSLKVSLSEIAFTYAATLAILLAVTNYVLLTSALKLPANGEFLFSVTLPFSVIFLLWTIVFYRHKKAQ